MPKRDGDYTEWMQAVDDELDNICGMTHYDLSDMPFKEMYNDGLDPVEVAQDTHRRALEWG